MLWSFRSLRLLGKDDIAEEEEENDVDLYLLLFLHLERDVSSAGAFPRRRAVRIPSIP